MADCETDSGVETTVTAVSGAGFETESEAKDAKLEALRPQRAGPDDQGEDVFHANLPGDLGLPPGVSDTERA